MVGVSKLVTNLCNSGSVGQGVAHAISQKFSPPGKLNSSSICASAVASLGNLQHGVTGPQLPGQKTLTTTAEPRTARLGVGVGGAGAASGVSVKASVEHLLTAQPTPTRDIRPILDHVEALQSGIAAEQLLDHLFNKYATTDILSLQRGQPLGAERYDPSELSIFKNAKQESAKGAADFSEKTILSRRPQNFVLSDKYSIQERINYERVLDGLSRTKTGQALLDRINKLGRDIPIEPPTQEHPDAVKGITSSDSGEVHANELTLHMDFSTADSASRMTGYGVDGNAIKDSRVVTFAHEVAHLLTASEIVAKVNHVKKARDTGQLSADEAGRQLHLIRQQLENVAVLVQNMVSAELGLPLRHPVYDDEYFQLGNIDKQFNDGHASFLEQINLGGERPLVVDLTSGRVRGFRDDETAHDVPFWREALRDEPPVHLLPRTLTRDAIKSYYLDPERVGHSDYQRHGDPVVYLKGEWTDGDLKQLQDTGIPLGSESNPSATYRVWSDGFKQVDIRSTDGSLLAMKPEYFDEFLKHHPEVKNVWIEFVDSDLGVKLRTRDEYHRARALPDHLL